MKKTIVYSLLVIAGFFGNKGFAQLITMTLQPGSTGIDAHVYSNAATTNYSTSVTLQAGRDGGGFRTRGLLAYDLSAIPSNAIISSATLTLYGTAHTGTNPAYLRKNTSAWTESAVTWNTLPSATAIGQISFAQSTSGTQTYTADVKTFVQEMVNIPASNYGWTLIKQNENVAGELVFGSSDNSNATLRPKLEIAYSLPMEVKAAMTPATGSLTADGALNISVTNGIPPFTYLWSDASTGKDLYNKAPGVYSFTVTDSEGNKVKKELLIAAENTALTFTITPDALSGMDGLIQRRDDGTLVNNVNKNYPQFKADRGTSSGWFSSRSLMAFDLSFLPAAAAVSSASLMLYGNGHNPLSRPNDSYLYLNTAPWYESSLTWNTQPAHTTTGSIYLAATSSSTQNASLDITSQVQGWVQDPSSNYGWKLMLADEATSSYTSRIYGASANATVALRPQLVITVSIPQLTDTYRNWEMEESYDENGTVIASQKTYMDELGRVTQSLSKDANGDVFGVQTVYDAYGRPALTSLPAYAGTTLNYNSRLLLNTGGTEYNYSNFDVSGKLTSPDPVQSGLANTVGTYYSNSNTLDTWQATATFPYNRTHYLAEPISDVKTVNSAEDAFNVSSGREARNYGMVCGDELKFILGNNNSYKVEMDPSDPLSTTALTVTAANYVKATKSISTSPDNKEVVSYSVGDQVIATCMSGLASPDNCTMTDVRNYMNWYGTQDIDIHVPEANKSSISFPLPTYKILSTTYTVSSGDIEYTLTDLNSETPLVSLVDYTINAGTRALTFSSAYLTANSGKPLFLRIAAAYTNTFVNSLTNFSSVPSGIVEYDLDYGRWSVNYYDVSGDLRKSVSAKGISCAAAGSVSMATVYDYSHLGQVVAKQSPDEGLVEYAYNTDGQLRFSQNAEQKLGKRFSYTSYDSQNRPVESGEFTNLSGSGSNGLYFQNYYGDYTAPYASNISSATIIDNKDGLNDTYCNDVYHSSYEELSSGDDVPAAYTYTASYLGKYKNGQLSKTWNENTSTWYKYDEAGRLFATVKQVKDANFISFAGSGDAQIKTYESAYDPYFGSVTNSWYQKNISGEYAEHQLFYDVNKRLNSVKFVPGSGSTAIQLVNLSYDKLGRLVRQVLNQSQGIDYVYTLSGRLKAINHPGLDNTMDRGGDAAAYTTTTKTVKLDLFGEIIEYYPGDYSRSGTSIEANTVGSYNGQIHGMRYKTRDVVNGVNTGANYIDYGGANQLQLISATNYGQQELANRYTYDDFGQLATSAFGTFTNTTGSFTARNEYKEFGVTNNSIGYDANGNITRLKRNAYVVGGSQELLDDLTYTISASGNNHTKVADVASNSFPMSFNFKNPGAGAQSFTYNAMGQLTASPDESVTAVSYYPNGQVKQVSFTNGNTTSHYYDDQGQRYKSVFYNAGTGVSKYNWYLFGVMYEYLSNVASFDLKELPVGGPGRVGVYKQDVTGLSIATGHLECELTDHLGNVRVTFKKNTDNTLSVLSKADYYAFGGQLPGRIWQQSGGEYRYGYQGQEKSMDETNWDNFELRNFNHDLGRWSAPDPYAQFHSPYLAMANNPVSKIDPNGGYIVASDAGMSQRVHFMQDLDRDRMAGAGRFNFNRVNSLYREALAQLVDKYLKSPTYMSSDYNDEGFLKALLAMNNDFLGLGYPAEMMSCGIDFVAAESRNTAIFKSLLDFNGSTANATAMAAAIQGPDPWFTGTPADRNAMGVSVGFEYYNHYVNGKYAGTYNNMEDAVKEAYVVFNDWLENAEVEGTSSSAPMYASLDGGPGNSGSNMSFKDYLTNTKGAGFAIGFDLGLSTNAQAPGVGFGGAVSLSCFMQTGGKWGGFLYTYGNYQGGGQLGYGAYDGYSAGGNLLFAVNTDGNLNPNNMAGSYKYTNLNVGGGAEFVVGGGWGYSSSSWNIFSIGASVGVGGGAEYAHQFGMGMTLRGYDYAIPTQQRSYFDILTNHATLGNSNFWKLGYSLFNKYR